MEHKDMGQLLASFSKVLSTVKPQSKQKCVALMSAWANDPCPKHRLQLQAFLDCSRNLVAAPTQGRA